VVAGRSRWWVAGLSLCLLVAGGAVTWRLVDSDPYVAPAPPASDDPVDAGGASRALDALERAVRRGDLAAAESLAPAGDAEAARQLRALVDNAEGLRVRGFAVRYVDEAGAATGDGTWAASVDATWRFAGFDEAPSNAEIVVRFRRDDDRVDVVGIGDGSGRRPVWMSGPITVRRSADTLVLVAGSERRASQYERRARVAVAEARRVLPQWDTGLVVEVPADTNGLDRALDAEPGEYDGIAAVTSSTDGSTAPGSPIHVFVNPAVFGRLGDTGAQVVMTHEAVHVATEAPNSAMPQWLLEGFADYVALRDVELPFSVTAGQIIQQVRRDGPPAELPDRAEFGSTDTHLGAAYESAWLACVVLADHGGERELVAFYEAMDGGADLDSQLTRRFGWTEEAFVAAWRQRLTDLAG
jgi:hypothetical protein